MSRLNVILVIIVIIGAVISSFGVTAMQRLQAGFLSVISPFLKTGSAVQRQIGAMGEGLKTLDQLERENEQLKAENKELRASNQIFRDLEAENSKASLGSGIQEAIHLQALARSDHLARRFRLVEHGAH